MFRSLRNRLILSHILPSLVIIPLLGIAMLFLVETHVLLPLVYTNLSNDAVLIAEVARTTPEIWASASNAQIFVEAAEPYLGGRLVLTDPYGHIIASTDPANPGLSGLTVELPELRTAARGDVIQIQNGPLAAVFAPVVTSDGQLLGVVRLTTRVLTVSEQIYQIRYLLGGVFLVAILVGIAMGSYLAVSISRPVRGVTQAINALAQGDFQSSLIEAGPDETRTLARAVNTLVDRLHGLEQARRQLLANLVHELGRPLGALRSAIQALLKGASRDEALAQELLNGIDAETLRLQRLLNDLAGLYDQVLGSLELNRQRLDLAEWLPDVLIPWQVAARAKDIDWRLELPGDLPALLADPDRLAQAIGNLCSNAVKYTPKGGGILICAGVEHSQLWIQVDDSGPGIPPQDQEVIFQPFYRGDHDRRIIQGMGLGLTIARDIINAHGGHVQLESQPGSGAKFTVWLPLS
jgi:two-component system sensor histidine kinase BaeS